MSGAALDRTFAALSGPTRRGVVDLLRAQPRPAGDLALELAVTPPALSRHAEGRRPRRPTRPGQRRHR